MMLWLLCALAWADDGREVEIHVQDPLRGVQGLLHAEVSGSAGFNKVIRFRDDGTSPDHTPNDSVYSAVTQIPDTMVHLKLTAGDRTWTGDAVLPDSDKDTVLRLQLGPESSLVVLQGARGMVGGPGPSGSPADGVWLWAVVLAAVGVGFGAAVRWMTARPPNAARLTDFTAGTPVLPRRFQSSETDRIFALLSENRVFVLGPVPEGAEVTRCVESRVTPEALIRAVEKAAIGPGPAPALVVTDPTALELPRRRSAAAALSAAIDRRFALWLVEGPEDWDGPPAQGIT